MMYFSLPLKKCTLATKKAFLPQFLTNLAETNIIL